jgi:hypothetical protein
VAIATDVFTNTGGLQFYALADQSDPGNATTLAEVGILTQDMEWEGHVLSGTVSDANVGLEYGVNVASNVFTVDTAVAHLAGALGIITTIFIPDPPDWRWGLNSKLNPWYLKTNLIRNTKT